MAAGVGKTLCTMDNIVALIDVAAPAPKSRRGAPATRSWSNCTRKVKKPKRLRNQPVRRYQVAVPRVLRTAAHGASEKVNAFLAVPVLSASHFLRA